MFEKLIIKYRSTTIKSQTVGSTYFKISVPWIGIFTVETFFIYTNRKIITEIYTQFNSVLAYHTIIEFASNNKNRHPN